MTVIQTRNLFPFIICTSAKRKKVPKVVKQGLKDFIVVDTETKEKHRICLLEALEICFYCLYLSVARRPKGCKDKPDAALNGVILETGGKQRYYAKPI